MGSLSRHGDAIRAQGYRTKKAPEGPKARKRVPNGRCALGEDCEEQTKTSQLNCPSCNGGKGAFYHLPCFFKRHRCVLGVKRVSSEMQYWDRCLYAPDKELRSTRTTPCSAVEYVRILQKGNILHSRQSAAVQPSHVLHRCVRDAALA